MMPSRDGLVALARGLMDLHGLEEWDVALTMRRTQLGRCVYPDRIELSWWLLREATEDEIRDVVLHEVAHALCPGDGHGEKWAAECARLGCRPEQLRDSTTLRAWKWVATCPRCGQKHRTHSKPTRLLACATCAPDVDPLIFVRAILPQVSARLNSMGEDHTNQ